VNLRDLGGIPTRAGATMAAGRLFRGAEPPVEAGLAARLITATGVRRVLDLRMEQEVEQSGPPLLPSVCEWVRLPLVETLEPHWPNPIDRTPPSTAQRYFEMLQAGREAMARIVDVLGDANTKPTLIHCVAGRDRTGIVIACLLDLLDVPDEVIGADYAISSEVDDEEGRNARPDNILLLLQLIRARFGSVREMLFASPAGKRSIERLEIALVESALPEVTHPLSQPLRQP